MATKPEPYLIHVDLKDDTQYEVPVVTQGDTAIFFLIRITDKGQSTPGLLDHFPTITLTSERPDGKSFYVLGNRVEGTNDVLVHLGTDETGLTGSVRAAVQLYSSDGRVTPRQFRYEVDKDFTGEYVPSDREGSLIEIVLGQGPRIMEEAEEATLASIQERAKMTGALAELESDKQDALSRVETVIEETYQSRVGANAAANRANTSADGADRIASATEEVRIATESVRQNTEAERLATEQARQETDNIRQSTDAVRQSTEVVRDDANAAGDYAREQGDIAKQQTAEQLEQMGTVAEVLEYVQDDFLPGIAEAQSETDQFVRQAVSDRNSGAQLAFWTGTQAEFDALSSRNPTVVYMVRK